MRNIVFVLSFVTLSFGCTYLTFEGYSYHFNKNYNHFTYNTSTNKKIFDTKTANEHHSAIGIYYDVSNKYSISATRYLNSYYRISTSYIVSRNYNINNNLSFSLNAGIVNGYTVYYDENQYDPIAYPSVKFEFSSFQIEISGTNKLLFMQLRFKIF